MQLRGWCGRAGGGSRAHSKCSIAAASLAPGRLPGRGERSCLCDEPPLLVPTGRPVGKTAAWGAAGRELAAQESWGSPWCEWAEVGVPPLCHSRRGGPRRMRASLTACSRRQHGSRAPGGSYIASALVRPKARRARRVALGLLGLLGLVAATLGLPGGRAKSAGGRGGWWPASSASWACWY